jgi:NAD(P)-dependent dehydrogenase (short-subunit alcohol dehydrogenase family)
MSESGGGPLSGRHALVTGGSRGIGLAVAVELARHGAALTLVARDRGRLAEAAAALPAGAACGVVACDVRAEAEVVAACAEARAARGPVDVLVNNAGAAVSASFARTERALWDEMLAVNLTATWLWTRTLLPGMVAAGWGRVVNVASTAGLAGHAYVSAYCAAKHGVVGLTRSLAAEVARSGVTVNAVCPGFTETDLVDEAVVNIVRTTGRSADEARAALAQRNPQRRLVRPAEVANAVGWLCLPGSEAVTGQAISVSGGEVMAG